MSDSAPLSAAENAQLVEFARACKAAARAVSLYPDAHPAIRSTIDRIVELTSAAQLQTSLRLVVVGRSLRVDGRPLGKADSAVTELAVLLHDHVIGELIVQAGAGADEWRQFLRTLGRPPDAVRADGGIAQVLLAAGHQHIHVKEIDYAQVLQERAGLTPADWDQVIAACLQNDGTFAPHILTRLIDAADNGGLGALLAAIDAQGSMANRSPRDRALGILRLLHAMIDQAGTDHPHKVDSLMRAMSAALAELSSDVILALVQLAAGQNASATGSGATTHAAPTDPSAVFAALADAMLNGMTNETIAHFVARHVGEPDSSTARLAQAFQALVQDGERRDRLLTLARTEASASPLGQTEQFEQLWEGIAQKLTSYSDRPFVSDDYARELSRAQTIPVERVQDDPPERIHAWVSTVETTELRSLDLVVMTDLLRLELDADRWAMLAPAVVGLLEDFLLVGDFDAVERLLAVLQQEPADGESRRVRPEAAPLVNALTTSSATRQMVHLLITAEDRVVPRISTMCLLLGDAVIPPLVAALAAEDRTRARERLTAMLAAFGASARPTFEELKSSADASVRRTAIQLLRQFGESDTLPDAAVLANERDAQAQRDAVRAVLGAGSERAYRLVEQALAGGTTASRESLMRAIATQRDDRVGALYAFLLRHVNHRGPLSAIYERALQGLAGSKTVEAVPALEEALYRGEWWSPRRTASLRATAAAALARIGTPEASAVLTKAASAGSRGVRAAARPHVRSSGAPR